MLGFIKNLSRFMTSDISLLCKQMTDIESHSDWMNAFYTSVPQSPGRGQVPGPGINYTGPREVLLEFVILVF